MLPSGFRVRMAASVTRHKLQKDLYAEHKKVRANFTIAVGTNDILQVVDYDLPVEVTFCEYLLADL